MLTQQAVHAFVFLQIETMDLVGSVDGCDCVIVDDMIDTAGTLCKAAKELVNNGGKW